MEMYKSRLKIGKDMKTVIFINHNHKKKSDAVTVEQLHHIHILDRSGSMTGSIKQLIENVKATIKYIPDGDYVSIIWFSSAGQYKTLIKGAQKDEKLNKLLDGIASTLGCTCFSESLEEVGTIIDDLATICPNFNVTLFTDGQPVIPWSTDEEIKRIYKAIDKWKNKVLALNTVGYGFYYNEKLLKDIAAKTQFGQFVHASKINDYMDIFSHNYTRMAELTSESVELEGPVGSDILFVGNKATKMVQGAMKLDRVEKKKNQFAIIADEEKFAFSYDGAIFKTDKDLFQKCTATMLENICYAYAYELYYAGERQTALDILACSIHDKALIDKQINAFTFDEVSDYTKLLQNAVFNRPARYIDGVAPDNYLPADDALCVMDILDALVAGDNYYIYATDYQRIGREVIDSDNAFRKLSGVIPMTPINELVFHKNKMNVSIRSKIDGTIRLNPKQAEKVGLPADVKSFVWRTQTIIKDGNLNMDTIEVAVDDNTLTRLERWNFHKANKQLLASDISHIPVSLDGKSTVYRHQITLNLAALPVINRLRLQAASTITRVFTATLALLHYEAKQKVLNYLIKKINETFKTVSDYMQQYTDEQITLLEEYGMAKDGSYKGISTALAEKNEQDYYEARTMEFQIKGSSSLPEVQGIIDAMKGGKLNRAGTIMKEYLQSLAKKFGDDSLLGSGDINAELLPDLQEELRSVKQSIMEFRTDVFSTKIAKTLTGDWFTELVPDNKGNYNFTNGEDILVAKFGREKCYF